jgi:putative SOS response-associated peptidase YedK
LDVSALRLPRKCAYLPLIHWRSMCGRYRLTSKERYLRDHFGLDDDPPWTPRWNIAPSQPIPTVQQDPKRPERTFHLARWGLIPYWAKDASIAFKTINAMSETAAEKPAFRDAMRWRRCLIPADSFYEWQKVGSKGKQPYNIGMMDDSVFAFAGLWERWRNAAGDAVETCTILTTEPNSLVAEIHNRMPAILRHEDYDLWLDPGVVDPSRVSDCLRPFDARLMKKYPVSTRVNSPDNDDLVCAQEIALPTTSQLLF